MKMTIIRPVEPYTSFDMLSSGDYFFLTEKGIKKYEMFMKTGDHHDKAVHITGWLRGNVCYLAESERVIPADITQMTVKVKSTGNHSNFPG